MQAPAACLCSWAFSWHEQLPYRYVQLCAAAAFKLLIAAVMFPAGLGKCAEGHRQCQCVHSLECVQERESSEVKGGSPAGSPHRRGLPFISHPALREQKSQPSVRLREGQPECRSTTQQLFTLTVNI